jgi:hypothetical protein
MDYLDIGGKTFIIDMERLTKVLDNNSPRDGIENETVIKFNGDTEVVKKKETIKKYDKGQEINAPKYSLINLCFEILFDERDEVDDSLGFIRGMNSKSFSFKLAFNTLRTYRILVEVQ